MQDYSLHEKTAWQPQPLLIYKPTKAGKGAALSLQLRLDPEWDENETLVRKNSHGLFLEIAPQEGVGEGGFAQFGWKSPKLQRVKLGFPDVTKFMTAYREVRLLGREVPVAYRPQDKTQAYVASSYHKFGAKGTAINYTFEETRSTIRISSSATNVGSIALELNEELAFQMYLEESLKQFFRYGIR